MLCTRIGRDGPRRAGWDVRGRQRFWRGSRFCQGPRLRLPTRERVALAWNATGHLVTNLIFALRISYVSDGAISIKLNFLVDITDCSKISEF
jgi:hypothetical protein